VKRTGRLTSRQSPFPQQREKEREKKEREREGGRIIYARVEGISVGALNSRQRGDSTGVSMD